MEGPKRTEPSKFFDTKGHFRLNTESVFVSESDLLLNPIRKEKEKPPPEGTGFLSNEFFMKKIVIVNSSPRNEGNCDLLCAQFYKGASQNPENEIVRINLKDKNFDFLREEQMEDDADAAARELMNSNVIVLATPVYFYTMSGMMKTFIDRMTPYFGQLSGKDFYFILTAAVNRSEMEQTVDALSGFTDSIPESNVVRVVYGSNVSQKGDILGHPAYQEVFDIASRIF